jgi:hypothetical protein
MAHPAVGAVGGGPAARGHPGHVLLRPPPGLDAQPGLQRGEPLFGNAQPACGFVAVLRVRRVVRAPGRTSTPGAVAVDVPAAHGSRRARHRKPLRSRRRGQHCAVGSLHQRHELSFSMIMDLRRLVRQPAMVQVSSVPGDKKDENLHRRREPAGIELAARYPAADTASRSQRTAGPDDLRLAAVTGGTWHQAHWGYGRSRGARRLLW